MVLTYLEIDKLGMHHNNNCAVNKRAPWLRVQAAFTKTMYIVAFDDFPCTYLHLAIHTAKLVLQKGWSFTRVVSQRGYHSHCIRI